MTIVSHFGNNLAESKDMMDAPTIVSRSEGLDFLRATLALWVLFSHLMPWADILHLGNALLHAVIKLSTTLFQPNAETHPAVLGFIVLSGYCIHRNGFRRSRENNPKVYAVRRFFRIWPVYFLASLTGVILFKLSSSLDSTMASMFLGTQEVTISGFIWKVTGASALIPAFYLGSWLGNAPLTTVAVEIWLYVAYAFAVKFSLIKTKEVYFWIAIICLWLTGLAFVVHDPDLLPWWHNGSFISFILYWWIGAKFLNKPFQEFIKAKVAAIILIWVLISVVLVLRSTELISLNSNYAFLLTEIRKVIFALLIGLLMIWLDNNQQGLYRGGSSIGKMGYTLYAFHAPFLVFMLLEGLNWYTVVIAVSIISLFMFSVYENPVNLFGKRFAKRFSI